MNSPHEPSSFATRLLRQEESLTSQEFQEYRMKLEQALNRAQRREKIGGRIVAITGVLSLALLFVGGSKLVGPFDPWEKEASVLSVSTGVLFLVSMVTFWISMASYYSRFRPGVKEAQEHLRDANLLDLKRQIHELRDLVEKRLPGSDSPKGD